MLYQTQQTQRPVLTGSTNADSMLASRLRRRPNIETALVQCLVFAGLQTLASIKSTRYFGFVYTIAVKVSGSTCLDPTLYLL